MRIFAAGLAIAAALLSAAPTQAGGIKVGVLTCYIEGGAGFIIGSSKDAECTFKPSHGGRREHYAGTIGRLGIDLGVTDGATLVWAVFAPGKIKRGGLKGSYTGANAEATLGVGLGANVLVGGFKRGINLQPISIQAQRGLNVAAGVASLSLRAL